MRSILIADSHTLCREALCAYIRHAEPAFTIGEAENLQGLQAQMMASPDIVLGEKSAGLGLSTVQGIVTAGGGAVVIETTRGQGTHAHVFVPRHIKKIQPMVAYWVRLLTFTGAGRT